MLQDSKVVMRDTVNVVIAGSNPAPGAIFLLTGCIEKKGCTV